MVERLEIVALKGKVIGAEEGVVGALLGIGLRLYGNEGRSRGYHYAMDNVDQTVGEIFRFTHNHHIISRSSWRFMSRPLICSHPQKNKKNRSKLKKTNQA